MALESSVIRRPIFISGRKFPSLGQRSRNFICPLNSSSKGNRFPSSVASNCINPAIFSGVCGLRLRRPSIFDARARPGVFSEEESSLGDDKGEVSGVDLENVRTLLKRGVVLGAMVTAVLVFGCKRAFAMEEVANAGYGLIEQCSIMMKNAWPKMAMVLKIFKEQGAILTVLLSLSAFFSMAETSIYYSMAMEEKQPEATASVDTATDNLIQITLREHFSNCTVLTIAHCITSVLDSDMVLLLNNGLIEEYNSPSGLLENKSSSFSQLVAEYTTRSTSTFSN